MIHAVGDNLAGQPRQSLRIALVQRGDCPGIGAVERSAGPLYSGEVGEHVDLEATASTLGAREH
jgi:hypothetical protein